VIVRIVNMRTRGFGVAAILGMLLAGCESRPHAPALIDEPVYSNAREGFRFRVPEGWKQYAKADVPPGKVDKERLLVAYRLMSAGAAAELEVSLHDLPIDSDLEKLLSGRSFGVEKWQAASPAEQIEINGAPAVRLTFSGRSGKEKLMKEVVAFRRLGRVYFFTGVYRPADERAREGIREAMGSILWKD
jgi:hypothetical protein